MKRLTHLLFGLMVIGFMLPSCTVYEHRARFQHDLTNAEARLVVHDLQVKNKVVLKMESGSSRRGTISEVNETNFVMKRWGKSKTVDYQDVAKMKYNVDEVLTALINLPWVVFVIIIIQTEWVSFAGY